MRGTRARPDEYPYLRRRTKRFWPPCITLSHNHHTPSRRNIHFHNQPAYGRGHRLYWHASLPRLWHGPTLPLRSLRQLLPVSRWLPALRRDGMRLTIPIHSTPLEPTWKFLGMLLGMHLGTHP